MKRISSTKLSFRREVLRQLSTSDLGRVRGQGGSSKCGNGTAGTGGTNNGEGNSESSCRSCAGKESCGPGVCISDFTAVTVGTVLDPGSGGGGDGGGGGVFGGGKLGAVFKP